MTTSAKTKKTKADLIKERDAALEELARLKSRNHGSSRPEFCLTGDLPNNAPEMVKACLGQQKLVTYGDAADALGIEKRNYRDEDSGEWVNWSMEVCKAFESVEAGASALLCNAKGGYGKKKLVDEHNAWLRKRNIPHVVPFTAKKQKVRKSNDVNDVISAAVADAILKLVK